MRHDRINETDEQKQARLTATRKRERERVAARRAAETPEQAEARRAYHREWKRARNAATKRKVRAENPERVRAVDRKRYTENKEKYLARSRRQNAKRKDERPWYTSVYNARVRAKSKQLPFDLDEAWAASVWTGNCALSGLPFDLGVRHGKVGPKARSPALDRVDPSKGYVKGNCRFILFCLNWMKLDEDEVRMYEVAEALLAAKPAC